MWQSIKALIFKPGFLLVVFVISAVFISIQLISLGTHPFVMPPLSHIPFDIMNQPEYLKQFMGRNFTEYNNFVIFKRSWFHLINGSNLYTVYPDEQWDFYKYSPTFALFMGSLAYLNDYIGLSIWNVLNGVTLFFAIRMLPFNTKVQCIIMWFILNDLLTSFSNTQSNGLMCALIIAAYGSMERGKPQWATLWLVISVFIKVYGIIGFCLFLFYPGKLRFIVYAALWTIVFAALPLVVTSPQTLLWQYQNWVALMKADAAATIGLSVTGWLHTWFGLSSGYGYVTLIGMGLFLLPFARFKLYKDHVFRLLILASMLIWVIIFNHKAESPTYVIAVAGVAIWYFAMPRAQWRTVLLFTVLVFTSLSNTDLFPPYIKQHFFKPYTIKAVPCIIAWCAIIIELMLLKPFQRPATAVK